MCVVTSAGHLTRSIWHLLSLLLRPGLMLPFLTLLIATPPLPYSLTPLSPTPIKYSNAIRTATPLVT